MVEHVWDFFCQVKCRGMPRNGDRESESSLYEFRLKRVPAKHMPPVTFSDCPPPPPLFSPPPLLSQCLAHSHSAVYLSVCYLINKEEAKTFVAACLHRITRAVKRDLYRNTKSKKSTPCRHGQNDTPTRKNPCHLQP